MIRNFAAPLKREGAMAVLHGNLAPGGAVIKQSAASPNLMRHTGRAVVFDSVEDMVTRIDLPIWMCMPRTFWFYAMRAPRALPACRRQDICRSREAGAPGRERYGADFRREDERHCLRHHRVAHHTRIGRGRPARDR